MSNKNMHKGPWQFLQFSSIGMMNAIVDIVFLNALLWLFPTEEKTLLVFFNTLSYTLTVINSYYWNSRITFKYGPRSLRVKVHFAIQALISLMISNLVFLVSIDLLTHFSLPILAVNNIAKGLAMALSSTSSFFFLKHLVFYQNGKS